MSRRERRTIRIVFSSRYDPKQSWASWIDDASTRSAVSSQSGHSRVRAGRPLVESGHSGSYRRRIMAFFFVLRAAQVAGGPCHGARPAIACFPSPPAKNTVLPHERRMKRRLKRQRFMPGTRTEGGPGRSGLPEAASATIASRRKKRTVCRQRPSRGGRRPARAQLQRSRDFSRTRRALSGRDRKPSRRTVSASA